MSTYLLRKGTNIPCTLDTQIITTQAGLTRCSVTKDVDVVCFFNKTFMTELYFDPVEKFYAMSGRK